MNREALYRQLIRQGYDREFAHIATTRYLDFYHGETGAFVRSVEAMVSEEERDGGVPFVEPEPDAAREPVWRTQEEYDGDIHDEGWEIRD